MVARELSRAAAFQDDCVDDVTAETRHAPPPSCWSALCPATWVNYVVKSHTLGSTTTSGITALSRVGGSGREWPCSRPRAPTKPAHPASSTPSGDTTGGPTV